MTEKPEASGLKCPEEKKIQSGSGGENKQSPQHEDENEFLLDHLDVDAHIERMFEHNVRVVKKALNRSVALQRLYKEVRMHDKAANEKKKIKNLLKMLHYRIMMLREVRHRNGTCRQCAEANPDLVMNF